MAKEKKKIKVRISARQTVIYRQIDEMTHEDWGRIKKTPPPQLRMAGFSEIGDWLDLADCDAHGFEDIELERLDAKENVIETYECP